MSLVGFGVGSVFGTAKSRSARFHAAAQTLAGVAVVALAVSLLVDASDAIP